jgi:hypothetical protein
LFLESKHITLLNNSDIDTYFICSICEGIVNSPVECKMCQKCFCSHCLNQWFEQQSKKQCPSCISEFHSNPMHRVLKNALNGIEIQCPANCGKTLSYSQIVFHLEEECEKAIVLCPFSCEEKIVKSELKSHKKHCTKYLKSCSQCTILYCEALDNHNCLDELKKHVIK